jgi:hypothetical protein
VKRRWRRNRSPRKGRIGRRALRTRLGGILAAKAVAKRPRLIQTAARRASVHRMVRLRAMRVASLILGSIRWRKLRPGTYCPRW